MPKPTPPEVVELVRKLAGQGQTSKQIGEVIGKAPKQVQQMYRKHNIACLPRGARKGNRCNPRKHTFDDNQAAEMYRQGMTHQQIGEALGVKSSRPSEVVRRRLQRLGVQSRVACAPGSRNGGYKHGRHDENERDRNRYECYRVVVDFLGMLLPKGWVIHHIDENPRNNSLANLALFPSAKHHNGFHRLLLDHQLKGTEEDAIRLLTKNGGRLLLQPKGQRKDAPDRALTALLRRAAKRDGYRTKWRHLANPGYRPRAPLPA